MNTKNRTLSEYVYDGLYLYFLGLSTAKVSKAMLFLHKIREAMLQSVWNWIQRYELKITSKRKKIDKHIVDETLIKVGTEYTCLWVRMSQTENRKIHALSISKERNMFVAERFISGLVKIHGNHPVKLNI